MARRGAGHRTGSFPGHFAADGHWSRAAAAKVMAWSSTSHVEIAYGSPTTLLHITMITWSMALFSMQTVSQPGHLG
jgi:hypothetical protein